MKAFERAIRFLPLCASVILTVLVTAWALFAQSPSRELDLEKIRGEIAKLDRTLKEIRQKTATAEQELDAVELELEIHSRELEMAIQIQSHLEVRRVEVHNEITRLQSIIAKQKKELGARLAALYRLGQLSYLRILLSVGSEANPFEAASMLTYLVNRDSRAVADYEFTREKLDLQLADLAEQSQRVTKARQSVVERRAAVERSRRTKSELLTRLQLESTRSEKRIEELAEKARRLERLMALLYQRSERGVVVTASIREFKGALDWPLAGETLEKFGRQRSDKFATYTLNNGIKVSGKPGERVNAVFEGTVLYSDWFRGYGNLVIVDHGSRVFSLYGNTRGVRVAAGSRVTTGQQIALVGEGEESDSGYLYFEIREDNKPADPEGWLR